MRNSIISRSLLASAFVVCLVSMASTAAMAREGSTRSIGNGIKCRNQAVLQADGTYKTQRVCFKGV
jgi:hypothetical protein